MSKITIENGRESLLRQILLALVISSSLSITADSSEAKPAEKPSDGTVVKRVTGDSPLRFDSAPVIKKIEPYEGFQVRDVAAGGDFVSIQNKALGLQLETESQKADGVVWIEANLTNLNKGDRAITLVYTIPAEGANWKWFQDPQTTIDTGNSGEFMKMSYWDSPKVGVRGRMSIYPLGAAGNSRSGIALGIDMDWPAFYRIGFNADTHELFLAVDIGLAT
jgi:hypothetical protein